MYTLCVVIYQTIFVKNAPFCHFGRGSCIFSLLQFCQKCLILSFCERPVYFFASSILSKMLNFVIFWEAHGFFDSSILSKMLNFVIFWEASAFFSIFQFLSKIVHFVIFETRTSNYEISIKEYYVYTMYCDISNYFCQKCPILSFCERFVYFFASSILSKMLNFVILWEDRGFFRFFNFVKNAQFCHFLREESVFFFHFFNFVINGPFCHIWKVDFKLWDKHKYTMSTHYVLWYSKLFLSNMPHFVILREARVFFRFFNFVKYAQFCHFVRGPWVFRFFNFVKSA